jgi:NCAIR mutase (PurE)-related protein
MLDEASIRRALLQLAEKQKSVEQVMAELRCLPYENLDFARLDHHRSLRRGCPEVIFCEGKTPAQVAAIAARLAERGPRMLGTRANRGHFDAAKAVLPDLQYDEAARCLWIEKDPRAHLRDGVTIVAAGTSDLPVAEEAARTLWLTGHAAHRITDVGVAGLHRVLDELPALTRANVVIVIAGMEGALPSVVAGLVSVPVIAVPSSVGYGASFGGLAALLGMLNSCVPGMAVVNIDNGFGAAYLAAQINSRIPEAPHER